MNAEEEICWLKVELATVKGELKASAMALELARDNKHFMWGLALSFILGTAGLVISLFAMSRH